VTAKPNDSPFLKGLMNMKDDFFSIGSINVGNDMYTRFWEDTWLGNKPLAQQYIVQRKQVLIANILSHKPLNINFRRTLYNKRWTLQLQLVQRLMNVQLTNEKDQFVWDLTTSGHYESLFLSFIFFNFSF
jgi:hypothetical protein